MSNVLVIKSSALGASSISNKLVDDVVAELKSGGATAVTTRDVGTTPLPHLDADGATALRGEPSTAAQKEWRERSDELVAELRAADTVVIGAPMYNFGIPSTLKAWFDHVLRAGISFRYTETGPEGLMKGKRAIVVLSRGGLYSEGPAQAMDAQEPHLRGMLGFIGITDVTFVRAEKLAFGPEAAAASIDGARASLREAAKLAA